MNNLTKRLLLFFLGIPGLGSLIFFLPHYNYLAINLLLVLFIQVGTLEMNNLLSARKIFTKNSFIRYFGWVLPTLAYLVSAGYLPDESLLMALFIFVSLIFLKPVFRKVSAEFSDVLSIIGGELTMIIYPGFLATFIIRLTSFEVPAAALIFLMAVVYLNDSNAWLFGTLFGRYTSKPLAVSPNKSMAGFYGGIFASLVITFGARFFFPQIFKAPIYGALIFALVAGGTSILGDLAESALKRSAGIKDSGTIIPGRGGVLDSIDSLFFTAPLVYYYLTIFT